MKTTLYIASHKSFWIPECSVYQLLHVGAALSNIKLSGLRDDTGQAISEKNSNYCELTGLYWIWKNDKTSDVIGLCHYRRYFAFQEGERSILRGIRQVLAGKDFKLYLEDMIEPSRLETYLDKYDVILPMPLCLPVNMEAHYKKYHIDEDWRIMKEVLYKLYPEYSASIPHVFGGKWLYPYNMFIMRKNVFNDYMFWLFSILHEVERKITISKIDYQARVFGFLAERLLNLYVYHQQLKVKEIPIVFVDENRSSLRYKNKNFKYLVRDIKKKW